MTFVADQEFSHKTKVMEFTRELSKVQLFEYDRVCNISHTFYDPLNMQIPPGMSPQYTGPTMCDDGSGTVIDADAYIADSTNYKHIIDVVGTNNIISGPGFLAPYNTTGIKTDKIGSMGPLNFNATLAPGALVQGFVSQSCFLSPNGQEWCHAYHVNINPQ